MWDGSWRKRIWGRRLIHLVHDTDSYEPGNESSNSTKGETFFFLLYVRFFKLYRRLFSPLRCHIDLYLCWTLFIARLKRLSKKYYIATSSPVVNLFLRHSLNEMKAQFSVLNTVFNAVSQKNLTWNLRRRQSLCLKFLSSRSI